MARSLLVAALLLAVGCKRSSAPSSAATPPPASASALGSTSASAPASASASAPAPLSCRALQSCTDSCADAACAEACVRRLTASARPAYDTLQACVVPACAAADAGAAPCRAPGSFACKMCVLSRCAAQAAACMSH